MSWFESQRKYVVKAVSTTSYTSSWVQLKKGVKKDSPRRTNDFDLIDAKELATQFSKVEAKKFARELNLSQSAFLKPNYQYEISRV